MVEEGFLCRGGKSQCLDLASDRKKEEGNGGYHVHNDSFGFANFLDATLREGCLVSHRFNLGETLPEAGGKLLRASQ